MMNSGKTVAEQWSHARDFQDGNVLVRVTKNQGYRPRYSVEIGRAVLPVGTEQPKVIRHFGVFIDTQLGKVGLRESIATRVSRLISEAENWIRDVTQQREDEILEERIARETKDANRGKPPTRQTGKTERKRKGGHHGN